MGRLNFWRECVGIEPTRPLIEGTSVLKTEGHTSTHPLPGQPYLMV